MLEVRPGQRTSFAMQIDPASAAVGREVALCRVREAPSDFIALPGCQVVASGGGVLCSSGDIDRGGSGGAVASFEACCDGEAVHVRGTTGVEVATGIMWFLKYRHAARMISCKGQGHRLPEPAGTAARKHAALMPTDAALPSNWSASHRTPPCWVGKTAVLKVSSTASHHTAPRWGDGQQFSAESQVDRVRDSSGVPPPAPSALPAPWGVLHLCAPHPGWGNLARAVACAGAAAR